MKRSQAALLSILFIILVITGCDKKEQKKNPFEHARMVDDTNNTSSLEKSHAKENNQSDLHIPNAKTYLLSDKYQEKNITVVIDEEHRLYMKEVSEPVIVLNFFSPWSYPSKNQLDYLVDLQKEHQGHLRIIGIVLNPHDNNDQTEKLLHKIGGDLFISTGKYNNAFTRQILEPLELPDFMPIPLTVIYHNGIYFRHYEGAVPIEMIDHDIQTIMQ